MSKFSNIETATYYPVVLPSTRESITYRPYNVREEKQLLMAEQSEDGIVMLKTLASVIANCLEPKQKNLTTFDIEYLFSQIRAKSVGEYANLRLGCENTGCEDVSFELKYPLSDIKVQYPEKEEFIIKVSPKLAFKMRYPNINEAIKIETITDPTEKKFVAVSSCITEVYNDDEIITVTEEDKNDIIALIDRLDKEQYSKLESFFESTPYIYGNVKYKCPKCKTEHNNLIRGLTSFFE